MHKCSYQLFLRKLTLPEDSLTAASVSSGSSSLSDRDSSSLPEVSTSSSPSLSSSSGREWRRFADMLSLSILESSEGSAGSRSRSDGNDKFAYSNCVTLGKRDNCMCRAHCFGLPSSSSSSSTGVEGRARLLSPPAEASGGSFLFTWAQNAND